MIYNSFKIILGSEVTSEQIEKSEMPEGVVSLMSTFEIGLTNYLLNYQKAVNGFRRLGSEISASDDLSDSALQSELEKYNSNCAIMRATENKRAISHLILNKWLPALENEELVLITFNRNSFGKYLLDTTQIQVDDIQSSFQQLLKFCTLKNQSVIYIVEIIGFDNYVFKESFQDQQSKSYYKLKEKL